MHNHLGGLVGIHFSKDKLKDEHVGLSELAGIIVAEDNKSKQAVGYVSFSAKPKKDEWYGKHIYLFEFAVQKKFRGKGIGKKLIRAVIMHCKKKKVNIKIDTLCKNKKIISFYKELGFKPFMTYFILENKKRLRL